ncbi:PIN domain-containing protein [Kutzneria albida]|uniref:PIN domain-containing protein n=1 Tax=Kutzneria albida DSM 43870 TaxID=1449976 RepID=W5WD21_9PSEU|nr:PIN domain-containing protein [Kutzneria albida]AHH98747.1 hypothetical protein KALB_5385 [Kutzneria albida DSM 43870]
MDSWPPEGQLDLAAAVRTGRRVACFPTPAGGRLPDMLVTCLPGVDRRNLRSTLREVCTDVGNLRGGGGLTAVERLNAYLDWAVVSVQKLGSQISAADIRRLIMTPRYELLLTFVGKVLDGVHAYPVNGLLNIEFDQRLAALEAARDAVEQQIQRWSRVGEFVVPDTSFYINHKEKLEEADFAPLIPAREEPIHVLVPIVVVDELDNLKQHSNRYVRWRAGYTLAVLDRVCRSSMGPVRLQDEDFSALNTGGIPRGEVTIEVVLDPPGHRRLPINDDEIVARAVALQPLAAREITLVTYDTGQAMRGRSAGLKVAKLQKQLEKEPPVQ